MTDCFRDHDARVLEESSSTAALVRKHGWEIRSFDVRGNQLTIVSTETDASARAARTRLLDARAALDRRRPPPHRSGRLVYWWAAPPTGSERAALGDCIRA